MRTFIFGTVIVLLCSAAQALPLSGQNASCAWNQCGPALLADYNLAQMPGSAQLLLAETADESSPEPESGSLIIPGEEKDQKDKKCLTVCKKWGEDCIINPRTGSRDCRRMCKAFGEECF